MNGFEIKRARRVERLQARAESATAESNKLHAKAHSMASVIPFGQPILVGHHSERRDRNYRAKIERNFRASFDASKKAEYYREKAAAAINNTAISSDDPEAVTKLQEKIANAEKLQEIMKAANRLLKKKGGPDREGLRKLSPVFTDARIDELIKGDFCGRIGFANYELTNNNANIRRMKERLQHLEARRQDEETEKIIKGVRIVENVDENRCQVFFDGKPAENVRAFLKSHGFRWSPYNGCWQRHRSNAATYYAQEAAELVV